MLKGDFFFHIIGRRTDKQNFSIDISGLKTGSKAEKATDVLPKKKKLRN